MNIQRIKSLALGVSLIATGVELPTSVSADVLPPELPISTYSAGTYMDLPSAQGGAVNPIAYEGTVDGALGDANDFVDSNGNPYDLFEFRVPDAPKPYIITVESSSFTAFSIVSAVNESQQAVPLQGAFVFTPGGKVQYSGNITESGTYLFDVRALDGATGDYKVTLSATLGPDGTGPGDDPVIPCGQPDSESPYDIDIEVGQSMNCALTTNEAWTVTDSAGGKHYAKLFHFQASGESLTIEATSSVSSTLVYWIDPEAMQILQKGEGSLRGQFTGDAYFLVTFTEAEKVGAFTVSVKENGPSPFSASGLGLDEIHLERN